MAANGRLLIQPATPEQNTASVSTIVRIQNAPIGPRTIQARIEADTITGIKGATIKFVMTPIMENCRNAKLSRGAAAKLATAEANTDCFARTATHPPAVFTWRCAYGMNITSEVIATNESRNPMSNTACGMINSVMMALAAVAESPSASRLKRYADVQKAAMRIERTIGGRKLAAAP